MSKSKKQNVRPLALFAAASAGVASVGMQTTYAAPITWIGANSASWTATTSWSTSTVPTSADDVTFSNSTAINAILPSGQTINSLNFSGTGTTTLKSNATTSRDLVINGGGLNVALGTGAITLGDSGATVAMRVGENQTWTNNSATALLIRNNFGLFSGATGTKTLTFDGTGSFTLNGTIAADPAGGALALVFNQAGSFSFGATNASGAYTGGTTIKRGTLTLNGMGMFGTGAVVLGDSFGSSSATLTFNANGNINNNFTVQSGSSGTVTINSSSASPIFAGTLTLNRATTFANAANSTVIVNTIQGTGDVILSGGGTVMLGNGGTTGGLAAGTSVSGSGIIGFNRSDNISLANNISGAVGLTQAGAGTLTLTGQTGGIHAGTGATRVSNGTLVLDFSNAVSATNLTAAGSQLTLGGTAGGTLNLIGKSATTTNAQTFSGTVLTAGFANNINLTAGDSGGALSLKLNGISRNAGTSINFTANAGSTITSTQSGSGIWVSAGGIAFATFNNTDWANKVASGDAAIQAASAGFYTSTTGTAVTLNADVASGVDTNLAASGTATSLRFNQNESRTLNLNGNTLTLSSGGLLITPNVATAGSKITGGTLRGSTGSANELVVFQNSAQPFEIASDIANSTVAATAFSKQGSGTLILTGNNSSTGQTYITGGTLQLGNGGSTGNLAAANINNNAALAFNRSDSALAISNNITGVGSVTSIGTGTTTLSGTNTFSGGLTVKSGTIVGTTTGSSFGSSTPTIQLGDTASNANNVALLGGGGTALTFAQPVNLNSGTTGTISVGNTAAATNTITFSGAISGTHALQVVNDATTANAVTLSGAMNQTGSVNAIGAGTGATTLSGAVNSGVSSITQESSGVLVVSGTNTNFAGSTTVNTGTLRIASATALGGNGTTTGTGGTLTVNNGANFDGSVTLTTTNAKTFNGSVGFLGTGALNLGPGAITLGTSTVTISHTGATNSLTLPSTASIGGTNFTLQTSNTGGFVVGSAINITGTLTNGGTGTGGLSLSSLVNSSVDAIVQDNANSTITISSATVGQVGTVGGYTGGITLKRGGVSVATSAAGGVNPISGAGTVSIGDSTGTDDATLSILNGVSAPLVNNALLIKEGSTGKKILRYSSTSGTGEFSGAMTLEDNPSLNVPVEVTFRKQQTGGGNFVQSGPISGNGKIIFENVASSTLTFKGNNSGFSGTAEFSTGNTAVDSVNALNANVLADVSSGASFTFNSGTGTLSVKGLTGQGTASVAASNRTLGVAGTGGSYDFEGVISNVGNFSKSGTSIQTLSGTNTYTGTTAVNGGTLIVNGRINSTAAVTVGGNGTSNTPTLGGSGTIVGAVTIAAAGTGQVGHIAPGNSPGQINLSTSLALNGTYDWEFDNAGALGNAGTNFDQIVTPTATLGAASVLNVSLTSGDYAGAFWNTDRSWTIIDGTTASGNFLTINSSAGAQGSFSTLTSGGDVILNWTANAPANSTVTLVSNNAVTANPVLTVNGDNGSYLGDSEDVSGNTGGVRITGFNPVTDSPVVIALDLEGLAGTVADFLATVTAPEGYTLVSATATNGNVPSWVGLTNQWSQSSSDWEAILAFAPTTPTGSPFDFNWDFSADPTVTVDRIAVVPEPGALGLAAVGVMGLISQRRRRRL